MYNYKNIPDLSGKIAIVTGANSGTGYGITYHLAKHNCKVIMASRSQGKLEKAKAELLTQLPNAQLELETLDLSDLKSISNFANRVKSRYSRIDFLANNAGGGPLKYELTKDGLEGQMAINYLGHFALTIQLLPTLKDDSRIVTFSSIGYKHFLKNNLDVDNLLVKKAEDFNQMQEYCKGKLCCILFSIKLQKELEKAGSKSLSLTCHPGWSRTNLGGQSGTVFATLVARVMNGASTLFGLSQSLYDGALPAIEALISDDAKSGVVYSPNKNTLLPEAKGEPVPKEIDHTHYKDEDIDKLWIKSQEFTKLDASEYL